MLLRNGADFFAVDNSGNTITAAARPTGADAWLDTLMQMYAAHATGADAWPDTLMQMYAEICA